MGGVFHECRTGDDMDASTACRHSLNLKESVPCDGWSFGLEYAFPEIYYCKLHTTHCGLSPLITISIFSGVKYSADHKVQ